MADELHLARTAQKPTLYAAMTAFQTEKMKKSCDLSKTKKGVMIPGSFTSPNAGPHQSLVPPLPWNSTAQHSDNTCVLYVSACLNRLLCLLVKGPYGTQQNFGKIPLEFVHKTCLVRENLHQMKKFRRGSKDSFYIYKQFLNARKMKE